MKLSRIPGREEQVKFACNIKASTNTLFEQYHAYCEAQAGIKIVRGDLLDQLLLDFISSDKDFVRAQKEAKPTKAAEATDVKSPAVQATPVEAKEPVAPAPAAPPRTTVSSLPGYS